MALDVVWNCMFGIDADLQHNYNFNYFVRIQEFLTNLADFGLSFMLTSNFSRNIFLSNQDQLKQIYLLFKSLFLRAKTANSELLFDLYVLPSQTRLEARKSVFLDDGSSA